MAEERLLNCTTHGSYYGRYEEDDDPENPPQADPCPWCQRDALRAKGEALAEAARGVSWLWKCSDKLPIPENTQRLHDALRAWERREDNMGAYIEDPIKSRDQAYTERNRLVALLAALYPSWKTRHPEEDESWEDDWRWIIGVELPTGQATWHIHDSELALFDHVEHRDVVWDGHTTEEKYGRIEALIRALRAWEQAARKES